jgi:hypothetical protein
MVIQEHRNAKTENAKVQRVHSSVRHHDDTPSYTYDLTAIQMFTYILRSISAGKNEVR